MSGIVITIGITSIICIGIALTVYLQARERAKIEKIRRITMLNERMINLQRLLSDLPPQYLNNALRLLIAKQSLITAKDLFQLKPNKRIRSYLDHSAEQLKSFQEAGPAPKAVPITDEAQAREARELLQILYTFLHRLHRTNAIDDKQAKQYIGHVGYLAHKSKADVYAMRGEQAQAANKIRSAIHAYHNAVESLGAVSSHPEAVANLEDYRTRIKKLTKIAEANNQRVKEEAQKKIENSSEWEEYLEEDKRDPYKDYD
jgi:vacuolar-type H+-ATPase subunit I/STV1